MASLRSRSRSPLKQEHEFLPGSGRASPTPSNVSGTTSTSNLSRKGKRLSQGTFQLKLTNVPTYWKWHNMSEYVKKHTSADKAIAADLTYIVLKANPQNANYQDGFIMFRTEHKRHQAFEKLKITTEKIDGKKLYVQKMDLGQNKSAHNSNNEKPNFMHTNANVALQRNQQHAMNMVYDPDADESETYGLSAQYLNELGITCRPLTRKVFIRYLPEQYHDEAKIRSVFSLAGTLVSVQLLAKKDSYFNVRIEYDHPVEAVQAVSMFNNRDLFNKTIKCEMDTLKKKIWVDGMLVQGAGLGPNGTPMRGVRVSVEIKKAKAEIMNEMQRLNDTLEELKAQVTNLMQVTNSQVQQTTPAVVQNIPNPMQNVANPLAALGNLLTNQLQPMQLLQNLIQPNAGTVSALGNALQSLSGSNMDLSSLIQHGNSNQSSPLQDRPNMQGSSNMQGAPSNNVPSVSFNNMQSGPNNMQKGPSNNTPSGSFNMQSGPANNMQPGPNNMQRGPNNMQRGSNNMQRGPNNMQRGPNNTQSGPFNAQSGPNNTNNGPNMHGELNNMHGGPNNMHGGPNNMHSGPNNMHSGPNNMHSGPNNMHSGPNNMHSGPNNMQRGPSNNMQSGPFNAQSGPNNMQSGPFNAQSGPNNMQSGPFNAQSGPNNMQSEPFNAQGGPNNMQSGPQNMQHGNPRPFNQGQNNSPGFNGQPNQQSGFSNMQSGFTNMQPHSGPGPNPQMNSGFEGPQFNNNMGRQEPIGPSSTMLLFRNLPASVTLQALQGKMREVGEIKLVEMTGQGRALVSFYSDFDADKCIRLFNHSKVDGQTIEVRKV